MVKKRTNFRLTRKAALAAAFILIVLVGLLLIWRHKKTVTTIPVAQPGAAVKSTGDKQTTSPPSSKPGSSPSPSPASTSPPVSSVDTTPPANPSGQFVNFHTRKLSGGTSETSEESTCITTPGASCYIEFISGNTTEKLPAQTTDSSGATVW